MSLIRSGIEVNAEISEEAKDDWRSEYATTDGAVLALVERFGVKAVLESIQCAAYGAAEVHADQGIDLVASARLFVFSSRLAEAIKALR